MSIYAIIGVAFAALVGLLKLVMGKNNDLQSELDVTKAQQNDIGLKTKQEAVEEELKRQQEALSNSKPEEKSPEEVSDYWNRKK